MRLSGFITTEMESILAEFEEFARTHTDAGQDMDIKGLRDHAHAILSAIALDLEQPQSDAEQARKSKGDAIDADAALTAAEQHGTDRAVSGFTLEEMFAEYRALRASVLRLWTLECGRLDEADLEDLIRFNEAIDQALAESIRRYATSMDHSREMLLAILGHDLRTPLSAVITGAGFLEESGELGESSLSMARTIRHSGERMSRLVSDLLDVTLTRLGRGIPADRTESDMAVIGTATVDEVRATHPSRQITFESAGDMVGQWDPARIQQALTNLVSNAVQHGAEKTPVTMRATGTRDEVALTVHNHGGPIPADETRGIFDPFKRLIASRGNRGNDRRSLGLGLYIAEQIITAHGGTIDVESDDARGTTFTMRLPRSGMGAREADRRQ